MEKVMWPTQMLERRNRVADIFARHDGVVFRDLVWPYKGDESKACVVALSRVPDGNGTKLNARWQPVHIQALDDERMIAQVAEHMAGQLSGKRQPKRG